MHCLKPSPSQSLSFPRRLRLSRGREFLAVYSAKARVSAGPLLIHGLPNDLGHPRLGFSVPARVGNAVRRNTIKRRLREAFRLIQHEFSGPARGYDLVIAVKPHEPLSLAEYQASIRQAMTGLHKRWSKRSSNKS